MIAIEKRTHHGAERHLRRVLEQELDLEARLDQEIKAVSLPGVSLPEAIEILKTQIGKDVNFILDPDPALSLATVQVTLDLKDVTLRRLLYLMLHSQKPTALNFVNYIDRSVLFAVQPLVQHEFPGSDAKFGLLTTAFLLCLFALLVAWKGGAP